MKSFDEVLWNVAVPAIEKERVLPDVDPRTPAPHASKDLKKVG